MSKDTKLKESIRLSRARQQSEKPSNGYDKYNAELDRADDDQEYNEYISEEQND